MAIILPSAPLSQAEATTVANGYQEQFTLSGYGAVAKVTEYPVYFAIAIPQELEAEYDAASPAQKLVFVQVCLQVMSEIPAPEDFNTRFIEIYNSL